ncbi:MAG: fluoride efflux transporter CrcB [Rhodospirillales bacterium]|nr:fluoride efflux transporter CrcB [Alphaproteobacteria bacterium]MCB9986340.1 fluoride efflux transporter CrcB [Rhodospirillales bacterium]USO07110.1 MAG: fluoride efflux transporter CrcB [Rhodospirillales bacterium]
MNALWVALGGAIGAAARYGIGVGLARASVNFPFGTLAANTLGGLIMGVLVGWLAMRDPVGPALKLFLTTGILGGFTTFSTFSLETVMLYDRKPMLAIVYVGASVALSIAACVLGLRMMRGA